ncbi:chaperone protein DnaJ-like [Salvia divinorum]|uniref:Chaperone protein DnaJ-like n=1 Tax=Salvia divinorum TaxID=28513 RepID=A0ABD1HJE1_SALDI
MECGGGSPLYYNVLGVATDSSDEEIRRAFRKLAMQWHPDKWSRRTPSLLGEAKHKFQKIQEAYSVLSDRSKRKLYDAGLYSCENDEDEGFADFVDEMVSLMKDAREEGKKYSMGEVQSMFWEMAQDFGMAGWDGSASVQHQDVWRCGQSSLYESGDFWHTQLVQMKK